MGISPSKWFEFDNEAPFHLKKSLFGAVHVANGMPRRSNNGLSRRAMKTQLGKR
jgi:hypothetical protein